jgi:hypothetical protein
LFLTIAGIFEGQDIASAIPKVSLIVTSKSAEWKYLREPRLIQVIIDGKTRATLGDARRINSEVGRPGGRVVEQLILDLPFSAIESLSRATKLEMRIDSDEIEFSSLQMKDLRDWVDRFPAAKTKKAP